MKVMTFSRFYPSYHPRKGEPTYFMEKIHKALNLKVALFDGPDPEAGRLLATYDHKVQFECEPKFHTIRAGHRWKVGELFSPRVWSGQPYRSKQIQFAPPIEVKKTWNFEQDLNGVYDINGKYIDTEDYTRLALNDGLTEEDMMYWFMPNYGKPKEFSGQIICWNETINY